MSRLTIQLSDKADALIAQLQKEIFNRRRKKVSPEGVVETLVESGAKSQSDKRFATSWKNLIGDIEKAAKLANAHGSKPASLTDAEWVLILSHRARAASAPKPPARKAAPAGKAKAKSAAKPKSAAKAKSKPSTPARNPLRKTATNASAGRATAAPKRKVATGRSSPARRMAKAMGRLGAAAAQLPEATSANGTAALNGLA
jgi:hypothetical protein